jgi:hypothetical protein
MWRVSNLVHETSFEPHNIHTSNLSGFRKSEYVELPGYASTIAIAKLVLHVLISVGLIVVKVEFKRVVGD